MYPIFQSYRRISFTTATGVNDRGTHSAENGPFQIWRAGVGKLLLTLFLPSAASCGRPDLAAFKRSLTLMISFKRGTPRVTCRMS